VKYWEFIADKLSRYGWSWGVSQAITHNRIIFIVDALSPDGRRFVVHSDELLSAFFELERTASSASLP
jgi:hypothetical protein